MGLIAGEMHFLRCHSLSVTIETKSGCVSYLNFSTVRARVRIEKQQILLDRGVNYLEKI